MVANLDDIVETEWWRRCRRCAAALFAMHWSPGYFMLLVMLAMERVTIADVQTAFVPADRKSTRQWERIMREYRQELERCARRLQICSDL